MLGNHDEATTRADGSFALPVSTATSGALAVTASGYARSMRPYNGGQSPQVTLRKLGSTTVVHLTADGNVNAVATAQSDGLNTSLELPPGALVRPDGTVATGDANVSITFWSPRSDFRSAPAPLVAEPPPWAPPGGLSALRSLGMADIEVEQDGELLQVSAGRRLLWRSEVPIELAGMGTGPNAYQTGKFLFYADPNSGLWTLTRETKLTYDRSNETLTAELPHLSGWNYDEYINYAPPPGCTSIDAVQGITPECQSDPVDLGGCVHGRVVDQSGAPVANDKIRIWLLGTFWTMYTDVTTGSNGEYCTNLGYNYCAYVAYGTIVCGPAANTLGYYITNAAQPGVGNGCDPRDPNSVACDPNAVQYPNIENMTFCTGWNYYIRDSTPTYTSPAGCAMPEVTITGCSYCAGSGPTTCPISGMPRTNACAQLPDFVISQSQMSPNACAVKAEGQPCNGLQECCGPGLICSDALCVPDNGL